MTSSPVSGPASGGKGLLVFRTLLGAAGIVLALVGVRDLLGFDWSRLLPTLEWLVVGNVLHDAVLAPLVVVLGVLLVRVAPEWARQPLATGFVVLGAMTLIAIPVLGNYGNAATNPSLMPRNYWAGWLVLVVLVLVGVAAGCWRNRRGAAGPDVERHTVGGEPTPPEDREAPPDVSRARRRRRRDRPRGGVVLPARRGVRRLGGGRR